MRIVLRSSWHLPCGRTLRRARASAFCTRRARCRAQPPERERAASWPASRSSSPACASPTAPSSADAGLRGWQPKGTTRWWRSTTLDSPLLGRAATGPGRPSRRRQQANILLFVDLTAPLHYAINGTLQLLGARCAAGLRVPVEPIAWWRHAWKRKQQLEEPIGAPSRPPLTPPRRTLQIARTGHTQVCQTPGTVRTVTGQTTHALHLRRSCAETIKDGNMLPFGAFMGTMPANTSAFSHYEFSPRHTTGRICVIDRAIAARSRLASPPMTSPIPGLGMSTP